MHAEIEKKIQAEFKSVQMQHRTLWSIYDQKIRVTSWLYDAVSI